MSSREVKFQSNSSEGIETSFGSQVDKLKIIFMQGLLDGSDNLDKKQQMLINDFVVISSLGTGSYSEVFKV